MSIVRSVLARVMVDDIDRALPLYCALSQGHEVQRFAFRDVELAWVGGFLLLSGPSESLAAYERTATLLVDDINQAEAAVTSNGGTVLEGPAQGPNGQRMIARHGDGALFEYIAPG